MPNGSMQHDHDRPLVRALRLLAEEPGRDRVFVSDLLSLMQDRAIVALILLFALPNVVPVPPGTTAVLGNDSTGCTCDVEVRGGPRAAFLVGDVNGLATPALGWEPDAVPLDGTR